MSAKLPHSGAEDAPADPSIMDLFAYESLKKMDFATADFKKAIEQVQKSELAYFMAAAEFLNDPANQDIVKQNGGIDHELIKVYAQKLKKLAQEEYERERLVTYAKKGMGAAVPNTVALPNAYPRVV